MNCREPTENETVMGMKTMTINRREHLKQLALGGAGLSMAGLAGRTLEASSGQPQVLHHSPTAKRVIFLFMHGGPSHVDTFDFKPELHLSLIHI